MEFKPEGCDAWLCKCNNGQDMICSLMQIKPTSTTRQCTEIVLGDDGIHILFIFTCQVTFHQFGLELYIFWPNKRDE